MILGALQRRRISFIFAFLICVIMCFSACGSMDVDSETDKDSAQARREEMWKYRDDDKVNQILYVTHTEGTQATAEFYIKVPEENNAWVM